MLRLAPNSWQCYNVTIKQFFALKLNNITRGRAQWAPGHHQHPPRAHEVNIVAQHITTMGGTTVGSVFDLLALYMAPEVERVCPSFAGRHAQRCLLGWRFPQQCSLFS